MSGTRIITQIEGVTPEDLLGQFVERLQAAGIMQSATIDDAKPMDPEAAAAFLGMSKSKLYKLTSKREPGGFPFHKQGGKLWFFRSELIAWIKGEPINDRRALTLTTR